MNNSMGIALWRILTMDTALNNINSSGIALWRILTMDTVLCNSKFTNSRDKMVFIF